MSEISDLFSRWSARDHRYAMRKISGHAAPLTNEEAIAIRMYRRGEAVDLPDNDRDLALMELARWSPPKVAIR